MDLTLQKLKENAAKARQIILQKNIKLKEFENQMKFLKIVLDNLFSYKDDEERIKQLNNAKSYDISIANKLPYDKTEGSLYLTIILQSDGIDSIIEIIKSGKNFKEIKKHINEIKGYLETEDIILKNAFP